MGKKILSMVLVLCVTSSLVSGISLAETGASVMQEEHIEVRQASSPEEFVDMTLELIDENDRGSYFDSIIIDTERNTTRVVSGESNEIKSNILHGDVLDIKSKNAWIDVSLILPEEQKQEIEKTQSTQDGMYVSVETLEKNGYEIACNENHEIVITNAFQTKRLIVRIGDAGVLKNTYGAKTMISDGEGKYVLQYQSMAATKRAYENLKINEEIDSVSRDHVVFCSDVQSVQGSGNPLVQEERNRWGAERIESDRMKQYLASKNKKTEIVVALVDTGVDLDHPFLKDRLISGGYDFLDNDKTPEDEYGHGTSCAGIIKDNTPDCVKILPLRAVRRDGHSGFEIAAAIDYAVKKGADIINMSFGGRCTAGDECEIKIAVNKAIKAGVVCIAAAGNDGCDCGNWCPSGIEKCITVASTDSEDNRDLWSNYGVCVDIAAPGEGIWSSDLNGTYNMASGTSLAAPFVSAGAAMLLINNSSLTVSGVEKELKKLAGDHGMQGVDKFYGAGILDFGIFFGENDKATSIDVVEEQIDVFISNSVKFETACVNLRFSPQNATHKYYTVKIANPAIASFNGVGFVGKSVGTTSVTFTGPNGIRDTVKLVCRKPIYWLDDVASQFSGGTGTKYDPYIVKTPQQLARISYLGKHFKLSNNTYFKQAADINLAGKIWYPIEGCDGNTDVARINYDGAGYSIKNLCIQQFESGNYIGSAAFFRTTAGELKNINLIDMDIDMADGESAGICVDFMGHMSNCYVSGKISGQASIAGGLVTHLKNVCGTGINTSIVNCRCDATVSSRTAGGIVGCMEFGRIENCIFLGAICADETKGGIVGCLQSGYLDARMEYPYYINRVINCVSVDNIVGRNESDASVGIAQFSNCFYSGTSESGIEPNSYGCKVKKVEKAEENQFRTTSFYKEAGRWNQERPWDFSKMWEMKGTYPRPRKLAEKLAAFCQFDYYEFEHSITVNGYYGKNPHVVIPNYINGKPVTYIDYNFRSNDVKVLSLKLPDTLRIISSGAFCDWAGNVAKSLVYVDLGNGVKDIGGFAFWRCDRLEAITIPASVEKIDNYSMSGVGLKYVFAEGDAKKVAKQVFYCGENSSLYLYYRKGKKGWSKYKPKEAMRKITLKTYDPKEPKRAYCIDSHDYICLTYGEKIKPTIVVFPESASKKKITYRAVDSKIAISKTGYITVKNKKSAYSKVVIRYGKKGIGHFATRSASAQGKYKIRFSGNGATSGKMPTQSANYYVFSRLPENKYQKAGYIFRGWSTKKNSKIPQLKDKDTAYKLAKDNKTITLYAIWEKIDYTVRFDANGGSGTMSTMTASYNISKKLMRNQFVAPRGKVFAGWAKTRNGQPIYTNEEKIKNLTSKNGAIVTLYAIWIKPKRYKIKYEVNGGKLSAGTKKTYQSGKGYMPKEPKKKGYKFAGWYTDKAMKKKITAIKPWQTGTIRLYAKWKK